MRGNMGLQKKYIIFGIIGCLCFGIGDWLLGYVAPAPIEGDVFYFIRVGHGAEYNLSKAAFTLALAMAGMCFLHPGFVHISDIAKDEKTKRSLGYAFGLCSVGWLTLHILVSVNVLAFAQAEKSGGRELAVTLSGSLGNAGMAALCCAGLFISVPLIMLCVDILRRKTYMERAEVFFTPLIPMAVILIAARILPQSPFSYGLYTFCMNGGMLVWLMYLFVMNRRGG